MKVYSFNGWTEPKERRFTVLRRRRLAADTHHNSTLAPGLFLHAQPNDPYNTHKTHTHTQTQAQAHTQTDALCSMHKRGTILSWFGGLTPGFQIFQIPLDIGD